MRPIRRAAFAALALSSCRLAASQFEGVPNLPTCAESCVVSSITLTNCDTVATGDACLCTSNAFVVGVACCAKAACSSADLAATVKFFDSFCASEGIALPATLVCDGVAVATPSATPPLSPSPTTPISSPQQQQPSQSTADALSLPASPSPSASAAGTPALSSSVTPNSSTILPTSTGSQTTPATTKTVFQTISTTPTTPAEQAASGSGGDSGGGLSTGAKAGIGAGAAVGGLVLLALAAFLVMQKKKRASAAAAGGDRAELAADGQQPQEWFEKDGVEAQQRHEAAAAEWKADQGGLNGLALLEPHEMPLTQPARAHELP
ncbi:hypothetical protein B0T24DRAFT_592615 [Lasiosphaeria ovina]|uniref:CFEM domain-containing protein n=1 Tax=Lasiosphaeria ovina TaxID=92902 RepID=A0AAE0KIU8_9PEZI|nr:hypothetical protein B0T24DRAFT_592615 [Lasiosphaeria ovina]